MAVLERAELRIRRADKALVICRDKSVTKVDQLLRATSKPCNKINLLMDAHQTKTPNQNTD